MLLFLPAILGDTWKLTLAKNHTNATYVILLYPLVNTNKQTQTQPYLYTQKDEDDDDEFCLWKETNKGKHKSTLSLLIRIMRMMNGDEYDDDEFCLPLETNKGKHKSTLSILSPALNSNLQPTFSSARNFFTNCWKHSKTKHGKKNWQKFLCLQISKNIWKQHSDII